MCWGSGPEAGGGRSGRGPAWRGMIVGISFRGPSLAVSVCPAWAAAGSCCHVLRLLPCLRLSATPSPPCSRVQALPVRVPLAPRVLLARDQREFPASVGEETKRRLNLATAYPDNPTRLLSYRRVRVPALPLSSSPPPLPLLMLPKSCRPTASHGRRSGLEKGGLKALRQHGRPARGGRSAAPPGRGAPTQAVRRESGM